MHGKSSLPCAIWYRSNHQVRWLCVPPPVPDLAHDRNSLPAAPLWNYSLMALMDASLNLPEPNNNSRQRDNQPVLHVCDPPGISIDFRVRYNPIDRANIVARRAGYWWGCVNHESAYPLRTQTSPAPDASSWSPLVRTRLDSSGRRSVPFA